MKAAPAPSHRARIAAAPASRDGEEGAGGAVVDGSTLHPPTRARDPDAWRRRPPCLCGPLVCRGTVHVHGAGARERLHPCRCAQCLSLHTCEAGPGGSCRNEEGCLAGCDAHARGGGDVGADTSGERVQVVVECCGEGEHSYRLVVLRVGGGGGHGGGGYDTLCAGYADTRVASGLDGADTVHGCDGTDTGVEVDHPYADPGGGHGGAGGREALNVDAEDRDLKNGVGAEHQGTRCRDADAGGEKGLQAARI